MQAVRADDKVKWARAGMSEFRPYVLGALLQAGDFVAEQDFRLALDRLEQQSGEIAARQGYEPSAGQLAKDARPEPGYAFAPVVDNPHFAHAVADALERVRKPHALGDVVAKSPEVDHVAAGAQARRALDDRGFKTGGVQPEGERRPGDACA